jgi:hypothetical protein
LGLRPLKIVDGLLADLVSVPPVVGTSCNAIPLETLPAHKELLVATRATLIQNALHRPNIIIARIHRFHC